MPPEHYESAVARAVEHIRAGGLEKVVSRVRSRSTRPSPTTLPRCSASCARASPAATSLGAGRGESAFVAASPELLVRREGMRASTVALAGSMRPLG